jgi:hypothetical protein
MYKENLWMNGEGDKGTGGGNFDRIYRIGKKGGEATTN